MSDETAKAAATPRRELERQIMDSGVPKNEREWWAAEEIAMLRDDLATANAERKKYRDDGILLWQHGIDQAKLVEDAVVAERERCAAIADAEAAEAYRNPRAASYRNPEQEKMARYTAERIAKVIRRAGVDSPTEVKRLKLCNECRWYSKPSGLWHLLPASSANRDTPRCLNPLVNSTRGMFLENGEWDSAAHAHHERCSDNGLSLCGTEGKLWEPISEHHHDSKNDNRR